MKLWDIAIRQPVFMTMILIAGMVLGALAYFSMPVDLFPDVDFPVVVVTTVYPGAGPEEVERQVTDLLEEELGAVAGLDEISSVSAESVSTVILFFTLDTPEIQAIQDVREEMSILRNRLPSEAEEPIIRRFNPTQSPLMFLSVADSSGATPPDLLRDQVEEFVQTPLLRIDGVADVAINGGQEREIRVEINEDELEARRITVNEIISALSMRNVNIPGGAVVEGDTELLVRTPGEYQSLEEIRNTVVRAGVTPIYVRDVATVVDGFVERDVISRLNGEEAIVLTVRKASGSNALAVSDEIKAQLERIRQANPDWEIVIGGDLAEQIGAAADGATEDLLWGSLLAGLVILFFFRNIRSTLITIAGLPVIMISTLFFMDLLNISLNQVSLLALALVVGLVIDDAIVVRENIMRWIERGYTPREASSRGTAEVLLPVLATSATILAVFLPVAYAQGIIGRFFRDFGLTVAMAIIVSTFEALTMAPMLSAYFFKPAKNVGEINDDIAREAEGRTWLDRLYARTLNFAMDYKWIVLLLTALIVAASVFSVNYINQAFLPDIDQGRFDVELELPPGTPLNVTEREAIQVESIVRSHPSVEDVFTTIGEVSKPNVATFSVQLKGGAKTPVPSRTVIEQLRTPLADVPGLGFQLPDAVTGGDAFLGTRDIILNLTAYSGSYVELGETAQRIAEQFSAVEGVTDMSVSYQPGRPEMEINVDPQKAGSFGLSSAQVGSTVRTLVSGQTVSGYRGEGSEADIVVRLSEDERNDIDKVMDIKLITPSGRLIPLRNVAAASFTTGPTLIQRVDRQPSVSIGFNITGRDLPEAQSQVVAMLPELDIPASMEIALGGDTEIQQESFQNLSLALLLSVVFVYMVLASQFGSFIQPLIIMLAMPLSVIGAILALALTGRPLDMTAFIGFIMLMGLVTKNSILLVDFANRERAQGRTADEAMRIAGPVRLRPILMTAFSLILAMIPVVLGLGAAGEFRSPMGTAIMGGMLTSTLLTLIVVPVGYSLIVGTLDRRSGRRKAAKEREAAEPDVPQLVGD
ncbi:MAG: efflux RND transporter permease subunit [Caldilineaceae bacterium]|nr:efflux RND transporter permease subunit [Caldilineaceae bacterium]